MMIKETIKYDNFELSEINRDIKINKFLEESMKKYGFLDAYPIHCEMNGNGKLKIISGHHRFYYAQKLGIPIKYVVLKSDVSIHELEKSSRKWSNADYLDSYCRIGLPHYIALRDYVRKSGIPLAFAVSMLSGETAGSCNVMRKKFTQGQFVIKNQEHADKVAEILDVIKQFNFPHATDKSFVNAVSRLIWVDRFSATKMKRKLRLFGHLLQRKSSWREYIMVFEEIYNRQSRDKLPLAFLADEAARMRNPIK